MKVNYMTTVLKNSKWFQPLKVNIKMTILKNILPNIIQRIVVSNWFYWWNLGASSIVSSNINATTRKISQFLRITNLLSYKAYYVLDSRFFRKTFSLSSKPLFSFESSDDIDFALFESWSINLTFFFFFGCFLSSSSAISGSSILGSLN